MVVQCAITTTVVKLVAPKGNPIDTAWLLFSRGPVSEYVDHGLELSGLPASPLTIHKSARATGVLMRCLCERPVPAGNERLALCGAARPSPGMSHYC